MELVARLEELIGPPETVPTAVDWRAIEEHYGLTFPSDYKELWARFPEFRVGKYWMINHPSFLVVDGQFRDMARTNYGVWDVQAGTDPQGLISMCDDVGGSHEVPPLPYYPELPGLLRWGDSDMVSGLMWLTDPDPECWKIVLADLDIDKWWTFDGGLVEFLIGLFSGELHCPLIEGGWRDAPIYEYQGMSEPRLIRGRMRQTGIWRLKGQSK